MRPAPRTARCYGLTRRGLLGAAGAAAAAALGCNDKRRPGGARSAFVQVGQRIEGDPDRIQEALDVWDGLGWPPLAVRMELQDPDPQSLPPNCTGCDPWVPLNRDGRAAGQAIAYTLPGASVVCTRGEEWAVVHELLHVLHQQEGHEPDWLHTDPRWAEVDRVAGELRVAMGRGR